MNELITRLTKSVGLSEEQAKQAISVITDFLGEKFPMMKGQIKNFLGEHEAADDDTPQVGGINLTGMG